MFECVINISEGVDAERLAALRRAAGDACVDVHTDPDHHRSVFTLADASLTIVAAAARTLTMAAFDALDLRAHTGVHPRFGIVDVVPFVALNDTPDARRDAVSAALEYADWVGGELDVPAFLYGDADPQHRTLPEVRRDAFVTRAPDVGPAEPDPRWGAVAVGARPPMLAVNVELDTEDLNAARAIAKRVRERDGGLPGVRALGFPIASRRVVQVSMNLTDLPATGMEAACTAVRDAAEAEGLRVHRVELVGLVPRAEFARWSDGFRAWADLDADVVIEQRVTARSQ